MAWNNYKMDRNIMGAYENKQEWAFERNVITDGKCPDLNRKVKTVFSEKAIRQIKTMCSELPENEWGAGLIGKKNEDGSFLIEEIKLFEQIGRGAFVELTDKGNEEMARTPTIGWIHSHNSMNSFFSGHDVEIAKQVDLSVVVNNKMDFAAKSKALVGCNGGSEALLDCEVYFQTELDEDIRKLAKELVRKTEIASATGNYGISDFSGKSRKDYSKWEEFCLYCGTIVGKRREEVDGGFVHKKCKAKYLDCVEEGEICDTCDKPFELCQCYEMCRICGMSAVMCECVPSAESSLEDGKMLLEYDY